MKASKASAITILFLVAIFMLMPAPQVQGALTADSFVTEITGWTSLSVEAHTVAVDSAGRIFVGADNDIYRSIDNGDTWTKVLDGVMGANLPLTLFVDSNDYVHTVQWNTTNAYLMYRSVDNGVTWSLEASGIPNTWHFDESSNGTLYFNTYSSNALQDFIYRSIDSGDTWTQWFNITEQLSILHAHVVAVDDNNDSRIWLSTGDTSAQMSLMYFNGSGWTTLETGTTFTSMFFDSSYWYGFADGSYLCYRIPLSNPVWTAKEIVFDLEAHMTTTNFAFDASKIGDLMMFGTEDGQLWMSWDGLRWAKFADFGDSASIFRFTRQTPIYFTESVAGKVYRLDVKKEDVIKIFYQQFNSLRGSLTNAQTYTLEQRLWNDTNYVDLTDVALTNVQASIKGLSRRNYMLTQSKIANAGWELNNTNGWQLFSGAGTYGLGSVSSDDKANGTSSLKYVKDASDSYDGWFRAYDGSVTTISMTRGDILLASAYIKGNVSSSDRVNVFFVNNTSGLNLKQTTFDLTTSWQRITAYYVLKLADSLTIRPTFYMVKNIAYEIFWDSLVVQKIESAVAYEDGDSTDSTQFVDKHSLVDFFTSDSATSNPTLTINSQTVSHSGSLSNGTESSSTSLTGILTGAVEVTTNIGGSGLGILKLTGTRLFYEEGTVIESRTNDVYRGRYFGSFSPSASTSDLAVLTSLQANVTDCFETATSLTFTVDSPTGTTSTTKVFCAGRGEPKSVTGADSSSYDNGVLTVTTSHSSSETVEVSWGGQASGGYNLIVYVKKDGVSYPNALVTVDGEEKDTDLLGQASFELTTGTYFVTASIGEETKNKTVTVHDSTSIGFEFLTFQPNQAPSIILEVAIVVVVGVVLYLFIYPMFVRRGKK